MSFLQDVRHAARRLLRAPGLTTAAVASLMLATGANALVFSVLNGLLLRALPYEEPDRLVAVWERDLDAARREGKGEGRLPLSVPNLRDFAAATEVFDGLAGYFPWNATVSGDASPQRVNASPVSVGFFRVLGVEPLLGRTFLPEEGVEGNTGVVLLGHELWRTRFGRDLDVLGKTLTIEGEPFTVVGVMPPGFDFPEETELWTPFAPPPHLGRGFNVMLGGGRGRDGLTLGAARERMDALTRRLAERFPDTSKDRDAVLVPLRDQLVGEIRPALLVLQAFVACVLLIACANVSNLLLAQGAHRQGEVAVRFALGAGRRRVMRQFLAEGLVLSLVAAAAALLLVVWGVRVLPPLLAEFLPRSEAITVDGRVLAFTVSVSLLTAVLCSLAPAVKVSRQPDLAAGLKAGRRGSGLGGGRFLQRATVVEMALVLTLTIAAGFLIRSFSRLLAVDPGFTTDDVLTMQLNLDSQYADRVQTTAFMREFLGRIESLPGVEAVGATWRLPLVGGGGMVGAQIEGRAQRESVAAQPVTPDYFRVLGIPLRQGRFFTAEDDADAPEVVIVNETMARRFWPGEDPLRRRIRFKATFRPAGEYPEAVREVVGVVGDVRSRGLDQPPEPEIYFAYDQALWRWTSVVVRTASGHPAGLAGPIREELHRIAPDVALDKVRTLEKLVAASVSGRGLNVWLLTTLTALALLLAAVGIYGVTAFGVHQGTPAIGLHLALGAQRHDVTWMVVRRALALGLAGILGGLVLTGAAYAAAATAESGELVETLLAEISPDPLMFAGVSLFLLAVVASVSLLAARRASRIEPSIALRAE